MEINLDLKHELKNFSNKKEQYTIPIFIPHKGCPNNCVFCNQKKISGQLTDVTAQDVEDKIEEYLKYYSNSKKKIEVAFFGGSFTGIPIDKQIEYLQVANSYVKKGLVGAIRISTRPDYINRNILDTMKKYNVKTIELGVQSMDNEILTLSKRGHTALDVVNASKLIHEYGIVLGHQIMIGLPGSTRESEVYTIKECLKLQPQQLRIYPVYVIPDSELYSMYENSEYKPLSINEAVIGCKAVIYECQKTDISIIRLGLQSTDEITAKNNDLRGPVSDNLAEYVMSALVRDKIEREIKNRQIDDSKLIINVPQKYVSICVGPKKINKIYFENKYNIKFIVKGG
mgnify:FL=1